MTSSFLQVPVTPMMQHRHAASSTHNQLQQGVHPASRMLHQQQMLLLSSADAAQHAA
jgi:hypothetical protein